jgi:hypothetical protein
MITEAYTRVDETQFRVPNNAIGSHHAKCRVGDVYDAGHPKDQANPIASRAYTLPLIRPLMMMSRIIEPRCYVLLPSLALPSKGEVLGLRCSFDKEPLIFYMLRRPAVSYRTYPCR